MKTLQSMLTKVVSKIMEILEKIMRTLTKAAERVIKVADTIRKGLEKLGNLLKTSAKDIPKQIEKEIRQIVDNMKNAMQNFLQKITKDVLDTLKKPAKLLEKTFDAFMKFTEVFQTVANVYTNVINARRSFAMADIAKISARYDSEIEMLEALIKALRKILNKIFEGLESQGAWMAELGQLQNKLWEDASQTVSQVAGANEA